MRDTLVFMHTQVNLYGLSQHRDAVLSSSHGPSGSRAAQEEGRQVISAGRGKLRMSISQGSTDNTEQAIFLPFACPRVC